MFTSEAGLNWRHNVMGFLQSLYVNVVVGSDAKDDVHAAGARGCAEGDAVGAPMRSLRRGPGLGFEMWA